MGWEIQPIQFPLCNSISRTPKVNVFILDGPEIAAFVDSEITGGQKCSPI